MSRNVHYCGYGSQTMRRVVIPSCESAGTVTLTANGQTYTAATAGAYNACVIDVTGLSAGGQYPYSIVFPDGETDSGVLRAHPATGDEFKIAWVGCVRHAASPMLLYQIANDPLVTDVVLMGDTPYGDLDTVTNMHGVSAATTIANTSADNWHNQYLTFHLASPVRAVGRVKGFVRIAGDHEFHDGWYDTTPNTTAATYYSQALSTFQNWCAGNPANADAEAAADNPSYTRYTIGPVELFLLDLIQYRVGLNSASDTGTPSSYTKTMLGIRQRDWLCSRLLSSTATLKAIMSGWRTGTGQTDHTDGWKVRQNEENYIRSYIDDNDIATTIWGTVDFHHPEVQHVASPWHFDLQPCPGNMNILHTPGAGYDGGLIAKYNTGGGPLTSDSGFQYGEIHVHAGWETATVRSIGSGGVWYAADFTLGVNAVQPRRTRMG